METVENKSNPPHSTKGNIVENQSFQDHHILPKFTFGKSDLSNYHKPPKWKYFENGAFRTTTPSQNANY